MWRPEHGGSTDNKVGRGEIPEFQAVAGACRFHFCTPDLQRGTLAERPGQNPSLLARPRALLPPDDCEAAIQS